jgi:hypothetical protein
VQKQAPKIGYSNLFDHVLKYHHDFVATMMASGTNTASLVSFIIQKSQTVCSAAGLGNDLQPAIFLV